MNRKIYSGLFMLLLVTLACRPVLAISWNEFLIVSSLMAVLLGPPLYRWMRRVDDFFKRKDKNK
jgi:hypothetical protein